MEKQLLNEIQLSVSRARSCVLFRNNTGVVWAGNIVKRSAGEIVLSNPRPIKAGLCVGSSDLIGWTEIEITPEMIGRKIAVFTAIEAKTGSVRLTKPQAHFIKTIKQAGGIAGEIREVSQVSDIVEAFKSGKE